MATDSMLTGNNAHYLELMLESYLDDPMSVDPSWRTYFKGEGRTFVDGPPPTDGPSFVPANLFSANPAGGASNARRGFGGSSGMEMLAAQSAIVQLIEAYRTFGHMKASLDPLEQAGRRTRPELEPHYWGLASTDMDRSFSTAALYAGPASMTLRELIVVLEETYCRTIGCEFMHINNADVQDWLQRRIERAQNHIILDRETEHYILDKLCAAESFEQFIHVKFRGAKRFSLEGGEALIPMLSMLVDESGRHGVKEIILGMPHRGRLNVLTHIFGKPPGEIFREYKDDRPDTMLGRGDVKYHLGYSNDATTRFGDTVHLSLSFNPSHLEAINPVVLGRVRAKQDRYGDVLGTRCLPVLLHGDAAFMGQGLVAETLNLMGLEGYSTGGTIHIVVNNQIGFTTLPSDSRSGPYCTEIAKMSEVPIFHVNGEDLEAVARVVHIASEFRATFHQDCIIDLVCFRRYGHNEADEPGFTQPLMYQTIADHPPVRATYAKYLIEAGHLTEAESKDMLDAHRARFDAALGSLGASDDEAPSPESHSFGGVWKGYCGGVDDIVPEANTAISKDVFDSVINAMVTVPDGFEIHPRLGRVMKRRAAILTDGTPIDWGVGELLAFGSLLSEGHPVRMTGQDVQRGTFSHRHAILNDHRTGEQASPLAPLAIGDARLDLYNSPLSEAAVLGFEFGYALDTPEALVIWEAQFGDFANGAQVIIDQFISSSEDKWGRLSAVTLLLPHGYEGQGPEHSSARLERYLAACAEDNMQVANLTTPAQIFHALRRQVHRSWRKPLVVMSPKSLLRHKHAVSTIEDFTEGGFQRVIGDDLTDPSTITRVVVCSGKVYYELHARREAMGVTDTAIVRLELLHPFPVETLSALYATYPSLNALVWCQEEPANMGAMAYLYPRFARAWGAELSLSWVSREASASPATGSAKAHRMEQDRLMAEVFPD